MTQVVLLRRYRQRLIEGMSHVAIPDACAPRSRGMMKHTRFTDSPINLLVLRTLRLAASGYLGETAEDQMSMFSPSRVRRR